MRFFKSGNDMIDSDEENGIEISIRVDNKTLILISATIIGSILLRILIQIFS